MVKIFFLVYLIVLSIFDGKERKIPVVGIALGNIVAVTVTVYRCVIHATEWEWLMLSALLGVIPGLALVLLASVTEQIGKGDGLVLMSVGLITGYADCVMLACFSMLFMSVCSIAILWSKRGNRNLQMPYIPFLAVVYLIGLFV